jgi:hypothetical protein
MQQYSGVDCGARISAWNSAMLSCTQSPKEAKFYQRCPISSSRTNNNTGRVKRSQNSGQFISWHTLGVDSLRRPISSYDPQERDFLDRSAVQVAAMTGQTKDLEIIIRWYEDRGETHRIDMLSRNAWHYVALGNHVDAAPTLLRNTDPVLSQFQVRDSRGRTPLEYAAAFGHTEILTFFLTDCYQYHTAEAQKSALELAIQGGHVKTVQRLLSLGAEPSHRHLLAAIDASTSDVVTLLLESGVRINDGRAESALHKATYTGKTPILSNLIWIGANVEATNSKLQTPLSVAVASGYIEAVKLLLQAGADPTVFVFKGTGGQGSDLIIPAVSWAAERYDRNSSAADRCWDRSILG